MIQKADPHERDDFRAVGIDVGASLAKIAVRSADGRLETRLLPSYAIERAAREVESLRASRLGLTGAGAPALARLLGFDTAPIDEFSAWGAGAAVLLAEQGATPIERDLLVSLGTGTSVLLIESDRVRRVGGSALGGGTLVGLGAALTGCSDFEELLALAERGDRSKVDLRVSELDPSGALPLDPELTAASFAKLAQGANAPAAAPQDLAHALVGMLGENLAILCGAFAALVQPQRIVYAGGLLRRRSLLYAILAQGGQALGRPVIFLDAGEFTGAVGALELAAQRAPLAT